MATNYEASVRTLVRTIVNLFPLMPIGDVARLLLETTNAWTSIIEGEKKDFAANLVKGNLKDIEPILDKGK